MAGNARKMKFVKANAEWVCEYGGYRAVIEKKGWNYYGSLYVLSAANRGQYEYKYSYPRTYYLKDMQEQIRENIELLLEKCDAMLRNRGRSALERYEYAPRTRIRFDDDEEQWWQK